MRLSELDRGCHGSQVELLQHMLNAAVHPLPPLALDGVFSRNTERAVRLYQSRAHLDVDGVVGCRTWLKLGAKPSMAPRAPAKPVAPPPGRSRSPVVPLAVPAAKSTKPKPPDRRQVPLDGAGAVVAAGDAPWMKIASAELGIHERTNEGSKRIIGYHATVAGHFQSDQVAWCSSFVNWCLKQVGIIGTNNAAAASWAHWGTELRQPRYGCILQLHHAAKGHDRATGSSSGNHVAFFLRGDGTHVELLGGNQSDSVKVSRFPIARYHIAALRWPSA